MIYTCKNCSASYEGDDPNYYDDEYETQSTGYDSDNHEGGQDSGITTVEPTCTSSGEYTYYYTCCGDYYSSESIPELGHDFSIEVVEYEGSWSSWTTTIEPTCEEDGEKERSRQLYFDEIETCSRCDYYFNYDMQDNGEETETETIPATGHNITTYDSDDYYSSWSSWETTEEATCGSSGEKERTRSSWYYEIDECSKCDYEEWSDAIYYDDEVDTETIPATGDHDYDHTGYYPEDDYLYGEWSDWSVDFESTCTKAGRESRHRDCYEYEIYTCSVCGDSYMDEENPLYSGWDYEYNELPLADHDWYYDRDEDATLCSVCNATWGAGDLTFAPKIEKDDNDLCDNIVMHQDFFITNNQKKKLAETNFVVNKID